MAIEPIPEETGIRDQGSGISQSATATTELAAPDALCAGIAPLPAEGEAEVVLSAKLARGVLDARLESTLAALAGQSQAPSPTLRQGHLALLKRWYYRPEARRNGEIFFPGPDGQWPVKAILRGVGRVAAKMLATGDRG
jgi:hypothetical protein